MKTFELEKRVVSLFAAFLCLSSHGQTFQVTTTADSGPGSLRDALANAGAAGGGTITFSTLSGPISVLSSLPDISGNLAILGNGPANTAISGNRSNLVFNVLAGATCSISELTVQSGAPPLGGTFPITNASAVVVNAGSLSISNCFIHDNGSGNLGSGYGRGRAISSSGPSLVLNNLILSNNVGNNLGAFGALNVRATNCVFVWNQTGYSCPIFAGGESVFSDCTFRRNSGIWDSSDGGGIRAGGNLTLLNCSVTNNYGDWSTGGIYFNGNNLVISNCVIKYNDAGRNIGGIYAVATNILIFNSSILENYAENNSAGMLISGNACLNGCTIASNGTAFGYIATPGLAISGNLNMTNCTISGNSTTFLPGRGLYSDKKSVVQAVNCTIAFNGYGVQNDGAFYALNTVIANNGTGPTNGDFSGTLTSQGYNLIGRLSTNTIIVGSTNGDIYGAAPLLGPLQNNGGPTLTHALLRGSPAINAGTSTGALLTDQRGIVRPCGKEVDIGAFEYDALLFTDISRVNSTNIHLQVEGPPKSSCTIQASSNFLDWENVFVSSNGTGVWEFVDQDAQNHPNRFYRAIEN